MDKMRKLRYDFNTIADVEASTGKTMGQLIVALFNSSFYAVRELMWAGLKWEDKGLQNHANGIDITGDLISVWFEKSGGNIGSLVEIIVTSLKDAGWIVPLSTEDAEGDGQGEVMEASTN